MHKNCTYTFCVYCKAKRANSTVVKDDIAEHREHIMSCPEHPLGILYENLNSAFSATSNQIIAIEDNSEPDPITTAQLTTRAIVYQELLAAIKQGEFENIVNGGRKMYQ